MDLNFYTKFEELDEATAEYKKIWREDGNKIIETIEKISELKFETDHLEAEIWEGISGSHPLRLRASYPVEVKKATLIHELCHILLADNGIKGDSLEIHKKINPILYGVWLNLYGEDFAKQMVEVEKKRGDIYKKAWEFVVK